MVDFLRSIFNPEKQAQYGIVALLDDEHDALIKDIWQEMETDIGVHFPFADPIPHITHIQAGGIRRDSIYDALEKFAQQQPPYLIRTAGIGIFTGDRNAVYVSVVRNPNLTAVQTNLIGALAGALDDIAETHLINHWMPHISLAFGLSSNDVDKLALIVKQMAQRNFVWEFKVSRLALIGEADKSPYIVNLQEA